MAYLNLHHGAYGRGPDKKGRKPRVFESSKGTRDTAELYNTVDVLTGRAEEAQHIINEEKTKLRGGEKIDAELVSDCSGKKHIKIKRQEWNRKPLKRIVDE